MRRSLPYGRHLIVPLLLLALVHAWTPRALWHWHDCGHLPHTVLLPTGCTSPCLLGGAVNPAPADPSIGQATTEPACDFSFDSLHLPPSGALAGGLWLLLPLGQLPEAVCRVPQPSLARSTLPTGRAPPARQ